MQTHTPKLFPFRFFAFFLPLAWALWIMLWFTIPAAAQRHEKWATPVESKHLQNFYKIDDGFYRSSQPSPAGFKELEAMGFTDILNFRSQNTDDDEARGTSLTLHHIRMHAGSPRSEELLEALQIIRDRKGPILIHCWHGSDRTGIITALYRMIWQDWTAEEAIGELRNGGYGYHPIYKDIITYLEGPGPIHLKEQLGGF